MSFWESRIILRVFFLLGSLTVIAFLIAKLSWLYVGLLIPVLFFQLYDYYRYQHKAIEKVDQFEETVKYRDCTRQFDEKHAPDDLRSLRKGFNQITSTFKQMSRERETQMQYLQKDHGNDQYGDHLLS